MDALHEFLSREMLSAKVISLQDLTLGLLILTIYFCIHKLYEEIKSKTQDVNSIGSEGAASYSNACAGSQVAVELKPRQNIAHISYAIRDVIDHMASSQYILKDKSEFRSIFQTPVRDSLHTLRSLAAELQESALGLQTEASGPKHLKTGRQTINNSVKKLSTRPVIINTANIFQSIVPSLKDYACSQKISLDVVESAHGMLNISSGMAEKIIRELVLNAIRHNQAGTRVTLRCCFANEFAIFEVIDDGKGLQASTSANILAAGAGRRYIRNRRLLDAETSFNLPSISALVRQSGGALEHSTAIGLGTSIRVLLPSKLILPSKFTQYLKPSSQGLNTPTITQNSSKKSVLYIGKQAHDGLALACSLEEQYDVSSFMHFDQALQAMFRVKPDIVIADFSWQHALGIQFCNFMRGDERFCDTPIIVVCAAIDQDTRIKTYASGVSAILEKPFATEELLTVTKNFISKQITFENQVKEGQVPYQAQIDFNSHSASSVFTEKLNQIMLNHYSLEAFNRFEASDLLNISEKTLQRRMTKHYGLSFTQYLRKYRLHKAREMLLEGDCITEVTYDSGFNSTSHFGQCFKQEFGHPPSMLLNTKGANDKESEQAF